ncbi:hypothetical protein ACE1CI_29765 [Aerosakkonemataceae cyanobacterium BLCC-F50]|uniref:Uncharacterized protein n=1 Tax=Floridaenema flaviceps BLCC-F50 TaxID=3153642 RepID=A0ABV4Y0Y7_9CYAN
MYWHSQYISLVSTIFFLWLANLSQTNKLYAQTNLPPSPSQALEGNILREDERQINQTQLPWVIVSNQPNLVIPFAVTNKISAFFTKEGLTPVSCSTNPVVVISVNNKYVACSSPTTKFPPGTYNTNIPDLETSNK